MKTEVRGQRSEDIGQRTEATGQRPPGRLRKRAWKPAPPKYTKENGWEYLGNGAGRKRNILTTDYTDGTDS
jgi:hypothetical protein